MMNIWRLAWSYLAYHRYRSLVLVVALSITMALPLAAHLLIRVYADGLTDRAHESPLLIGRRGNRFDLVFRALYFTDAPVTETNLAEVESLAESGLAVPLPLHVRHTARGFPVVGTWYDYFSARGLDVAAGRLPGVLGEAVVGAQVAADLELSPGAELFSDPPELINLAGTLPLKMKVVGVLRPAGTPDDGAVFVDLKTAWIMDGLCHGHQDMSTSDTADGLVLRREAGNVTAAPGIYEYNEVTPDNIASFHVHASADQLPVSAVLAIPLNQKSATLLRARYDASPTHQAVVPLEVVEDLLNLVLQIRRFLDKAFVLVALSSALFVAIVMILSRQLRQREMDTMVRIGCPRGTMVRLQLAEVSFLLLGSVLSALAVCGVALWLAPELPGWLS
jgi:putative ABC transport system permease protein